MGWCGLTYLWGGVFSLTYGELWSHRFMGCCGLTFIWGVVVSRIYGVLWSHGLAAPPTSQQIGQFPPKRVKYRHRHHFYFFVIHSRHFFALNQSEARFVELGEYFQNMLNGAFWTPNTNYGFVAGRRILRTRFTKQKFAQLRTNYVRRTFFRFHKNNPT